MPSALSGPLQSFLHTPVFESDNVTLLLKILYFHDIFRLEVVICFCLNLSIHPLHLSVITQLWVFSVPSAWNVLPPGHQCLLLLIVQVSVLSSLCDHPVYTVSPLPVCHSRSHHPVSLLSRICLYTCVTEFPINASSVSIPYLFTAVFSAPRIMPSA